MSELLKSARFPSVVDSSMLSSSPCPTKFFYQYVLNLSPYQKSIDLHAGGAFAEAVQVVRINFYKNQLPLEECLKEGMKAFINYWGEYEIPEFHPKKYKDFINVLYAVFDYFSVYHPATDHIQPYRRSDGSPAVEFTFAIPLPINHPDTGEPILYAGRSDMVGVYSNFNCVVDEKTAYAFGDKWANSFSMRGQFLGYCWAGQQHGLETNMAVVRGIAIQQREIKHQEALLQFAQWQIDRWYSEMLRKVEQLVSYYIDFKERVEIDCDDSALAAWPLNYGDICSSFSGCEMMDLCTTENPSNWFPNFTQRNWNPLFKDNTREEEPTHNV